MLVLLFLEQWHNEDATIVGTDNLRRRVVVLKDDPRRNVLICEEEPELARVVD